MSRKSLRCTPTTKAIRSPMLARQKTDPDAISASARIPGVGFSVRGNTDNLLTFGGAALGGVLIVMGVDALLRPRAA